MKTLEEQVEEFEDYLAPLLGYVMDDGEWKIYGIDGVLERPAHTNDLDNAVGKHKQALLTAEKRERDRIKDFAKNDWVFPPPDITGHLHGRAELPAEYVRRMVLTSLLPDKQRITD